MPKYNVIISFSDKEYGIEISGQARVFVDAPNEDVAEEEACALLGSTWVAGNQEVIYIGEGTAHPHG